MYCFWLSATVTEEVGTAALQALNAVHARNLLHGDVEPRNIMVVRGPQPSVRLVDFGFARESSNRNSQKAEFRKLQHLLEDILGVGVGKESDGVRYPHKRLCLV
jgi:serine/threonine protein kinase